MAVGMRNWTPFIADAIEELRGRGIVRVIGIPLAPQVSTLSIGKYFTAASRRSRTAWSWSGVALVLHAPAAAARVRRARPRRSPGA